MSARAVIVSVALFILCGLIINTVPVYTLKASLLRGAKNNILTRGEGIALGAPAIAAEGERLIRTDENGRVTYDSAARDNLTGKVLLLPIIQNALGKNKGAEASLEDEALVAYSACPAERGAVYLWQRDTQPPKTLKSARIFLFIISLIIGILLITVINLGAFLTKRRIKTLTDGISENGQGGEIPISGDDEITDLAVKLNMVSAQIMETEELRRNFVSDASHELRTPLSAIQLLVDSIRETENIDVATVREFMSDIGDQIERLTRIAERLLTLTHLDGARDIPLEPVDMKKVAESVIVTLEQSAREAQVALKCNFAEEVVFMGTSDGAYQIIFNLVENAIKYNHPGGEVRVYIFKRDGVCSLIVDDNGIGIPESDYEFIFERFYRVDKARSRDKGGSGLGLSIVAKIVDYCKGEISVEPSVDGGTRFVVTFPEEVIR